MTKHTILFLAANPLGADRLALDKEARAIQVALERSSHRDQFELVTRWAAQPLDFLDGLCKLKPTVVHFSGHGSGGTQSERRSDEVSRRDVVDALGRPGDDYPCGLCFQGPDGRPQLVSAAALEETFGAAGSSVKVVVLNACYSEAQAQVLVALVDCVVGMEGSIRDDAARNFAIGFYGGIGESESIAAAYKQGCAAISLEGLRESDRPRLKVRPGVDANRLILGFDRPGFPSSVCERAASQSEPASGAQAHGRGDEAPRTPRLIELTLAPPEVPYAVERSALERQLAALAATSPVVLVEGLAGSGKSTALARYLKTAVPGRVYWYEVVPGETIDGLFSSLGTDIAPESDAPRIRAVELLNKIAMDGRVLVVDGYDLGDQRSFGVLLSASRRLRHPATLFLVSRAFVDGLIAFPAAGRVRVPGFTTDEIEALLTALGGRNLARYARRLVDVCAGLPLAVTLFAALVKNFGREPELLLRGEMMQHDRLREWFDDVTARIGSNAKRLLAMVSAPSRPFTRRLARALAYVAGIPEADRLLDELHRSFLVTSYGAQRSTVHRLLATLAQATLSDEDRRLAYRATGQYYQESVAQPLRRRHTRSEFSTLVAACRSFQAAFEATRADHLIDALAGTAKAHGYYEALIDVCERQLELSCQSVGWVKYHLAHCYLIIGTPSTSLRIAESLVLETPVADNKLRIAALRVQAEALIELGLAGQALKTLRDGYPSLRLGSLPRNVVAHTQSIECRALYGDGQYEESLRLSDVVLAHALRAKDPRAEAIALVRRAIAKLQLGRGAETTERDLRQAVGLFYAEGDRRGHAWALTTLGHLLISTGHESDGLANFKLAFKFLRQSGFYNIDHHRRMIATRREVSSAAGRELLDAELARLNDFAPSYMSGSPLGGWRSDVLLDREPALPDATGAPTRESIG